MVVQRLNKFGNVAALVNLAAFDKMVAIGIESLALMSYPEIQIILGLGMWVPKLGLEK